MTPKEVSRKTYSELTTALSISTADNTSLNVNKIWNLLYSSNLIVKNNSQLIFPVVNLCLKVEEINKNIYSMFLQYILNKVNFNISITIPLTSFSIQIPTIITTIPNDTQNNFIYTNFTVSLQNELNSFLDGDQELFLINNKQSLETLWGSLILSLQDYRKFFQPFDLTSIITNFNEVSNVLRESEEDKINSNFSTNQALSQSVSLASKVNIESPVSYNNNESWLNLFENVYNIVNSQVITNKRDFLIRNSISSALDNILISERSSFDVKKNYRTNYTFEASEDNAKNKQIKLDNKKINTTNWENAIVTYYNSSNGFTRSKIIDVTSSGDNKILTLDPYKGVSNDIKTFTFPTIGQGINVEKDFSSITFTKNTDNSELRLFSLNITTGTDNTSVKNFDFYLNNNVFKNNYVNLEFLKNSFSLNYINLSKIKTFEKNFQEIVFNKVNDSNIVLFNAKVEYSNPTRIINQNYVFPSSIFNTNLFKNDFSSITSEFNNRAFDVRYETFSIDQSNINLFNFKVNYKNSTQQSYLFKLSNNIFKTNRFVNVNTPESIIYWEKYYDDNDINDGVGNYEGVIQDISLTSDSQGEITINKNSSCSGNTGFSNIFFLNNNEKNLDINFDFDYYISSSGSSLAEEDITFKIISLSLENNNQVESVKNYTLPANQLSLDTQYSAHFSFTAKNYTSYRFLINFNEKNNKNIIIKFNNFYVGRTSLNSTSYPYSNIDNLLEDFYLYNYESIISSKLAVSKKVINGINYLSFYTDLLNNSNVNSVQFDNVNTNLNWFNDNELISNYQILNSFISITKNVNPLSFTVLKQKSPVLGGKIISQFYVPSNEVNLTLNVQFKYKILNTSFSTTDVIFKIVKNSDNSTIKEFSINENSKTKDVQYTANFTFIPSEATNYTFLMEINSQQIIDVNINLADIYIGTENSSQLTKTYKTINSFLNDFLQYNRDNVSLFTLTNVNNTKIKFYSNVFEDSSANNFTFTSIQNNLNWLFGDSSLTNYSVNPKISFNYDNSDGLQGFILNKNNTNLENSFVYTNFLINDSDLNTNLNLNITYNILSNTFNLNDIVIQIYSVNNNIESTNPIKSWNLNPQTNQEQLINDSFTTTSSKNYRLKIKINSNSTNSLILKFRNFYIGKTGFSQNTVTYSNPKNFINDLYLTENFKNSNFLIFSYKSSTDTNADNITSTSYKISFTSEPFYLGSNTKYTFTNVNQNLQSLLGNNITYSGKDPILYNDSGYEKKYYDSFISLLRRIFSVLNSYALARLYVPEAFDEEEDFFNAGVNIPFSIKNYIRDLIDEKISNLTFEEIIKKDPRSNFLKKAPDQDFVKEIVWKQTVPKDAFNIKQLAKFRSTLEKIKSLLKKVKSILNAIKAFIDILDQLIELGEDILGALLEVVIKQVEKIVNNVASTGLYWFPVIEYYSLNILSDEGFKRRIINTLDGINESFADYVTSPFEEDQSITTSNDFIKDVLEFKSSNSNMVVDDFSRDISRVGGRPDQNLIDNFFYLPFKSTTYQEFIEVIIDGLNDPHDLPEIGIRTKIDKDNKKINYDINFIANDDKRILRPGAPRWSQGNNSTVVVVAINLPAPEDLTTGIVGFVKGIIAILKPIDKLVNFSFEINKNKSWNARKKEKQDAREQRNQKINKEMEDLRSAFWNSKNDRGETFNDKYKEHQKKYNEFKSKELPSIKNYEERFALGGTSITKERYTQLKEIQRNFEASDLKFKNDIREYDDKIEKKVLQRKYDESYYEGYLTRLINYLEDFLYLKEEKQFKKTENESRDESSTYIDDVKDSFSRYSEIFNSVLIDDVLDSRDGIFSGYRSQYPDFYGISIGSVFPGLFSLLKGFLNKLKKFNEDESTFSLSEAFELLIEPIENFINDIEDLIETIETIINFIDAITKINFSYLTIKTGNGIEDIINQLENATGFPNEDKRQIILGGLLGASFIDPNSGQFDLTGYFNEAANEFKEDAKDLLNDLKLSNEEQGINFLNKFFGP